MIDDRRFLELLDIRAHHPERIGQAAGKRRRRSLLAGDGRTCIIAADHPARAALKVGSDPLAMARRRDLLTRLLVGLAQPGVDGVLATPDVIEDLLLLGALENRVAIGSMNRGGLPGAAWELDDRFTAYDADAIAAGGLDGGKMLLRLALNDTGTADTLEGCARAVSALAARRLVAMIEPLPACRESNGTVTISKQPDDLVRAISVAVGPRYHVRLHLAQGARHRRHRAGARRDHTADAAARRRSRHPPGGSVRGLEARAASAAGPWARRRARAPLSTRR